MIPVTELRNGEYVMLDANHGGRPLRALFQGIFASEAEAMHEGGVLLTIAALPGAGSVARFRILSDVVGVFRVMPDGTMCDDVGHVISVTERVAYGLG